ncbi:MAG: enoyl-CoA hydratase-related protein [Rhodospirillales bacterium]|nr:enoyl-CoA hydratase-related protein [Rhodospirillales bacterium]
MDPSIDLMTLSAKTIGQDEEKKSMPHPELPVSREGEIAVVTFNRPKVRNALDRAMWEALAEAMEGLSGDESLRSVVLRGTGGTFSAGADIRTFAEERGTRAREDRYAEVVHRGMQSIRLCRHPVVAAIEGACIGGGAGIATMCDFRVGGEGIRFGITARNLGIWYAYAEIDPILSLAGSGVAAELLIEGRIFNGREAYEKGLLSRVVPDGVVEQEGMALARRIAEGSPLSARFHKQAIRRLRGPLPVGPEEEAEANGFAETEDFRNAFRAFLTKEKPRFVGR